MALVNEELRPEVERILTRFDFEHLPVREKVISAPFYDLACEIAGSTNNAKTEAALRKLLEAKLAAIQAVLEEDE